MTDRTHPDSGFPIAYSHYATYAEYVEALHARIAELEAQLEAIGAGGVNGPPIGQPQAMPDLSALTERGAKAWTGVDAQALREGRWYMVTHDGVATLCEDRRDAEKEAKDADMAWPHSGPHRAVQLVEASTAGFTAVDMATASAQGFRDGVASVAANAREPVAWMYHDARNAEEAHPWLHSTMVVLAADRRPGLRGETPLYLAAPPTAQAEGVIAEQALRKVLAAVQRYMPPDGPDAKNTLSEIIAIVDPWPLGPLEK